MQTVTDIKAAAWDGVAETLRPIPELGHDMSLINTLVYGIEASRNTGFVWLPNALGSLATRLDKDIHQLDLPMQPVPYSTEMIRSHLDPATQSLAVRFLRRAVKQAFRECSIKSQVQLLFNSYTSEASDLKRHVDVVPEAAPVILAVLAAKRQLNYQISSVDVDERVCHIPTGTGDLIFQTSPKWGRAQPLFHGVTQGPRRTIVMFGADLPAAS